MGKTKKKAHLAVKAGPKKNSGRGRTLAALEAKPKPSPFEVIQPKRKFDVLGRRNKGDNKNLAVARGEGIQKRKSTLLEEYKQKGKSNSFKDMRFGESNPGMSQEDKAIARFQRVRTAQLKKGSKFNLADDGEEDELTHMGQALANIEDFSQAAPSDDADATTARELDAQMVRDLHFGGGESKHGNSENKTKKQVMEELIAKSKYHKGLRQQEKEEDEAKLEELDSTFRLMQETGELYAGMRKNCPKDKPAADDYDKMTRQLAGELRAHAGDRTKTPEEVAAAQAEKLETLEHLRKKRMRGDSGDADSGDDDDQMPKGGFAKRRAMREKNQNSKQPSGEDLEDDFQSGSESGSEEDEEEDDPDKEENEEVEEEDDESGDPLRKRLKQVSAEMRPDLKAGWDRLKKLMVADDEMMKKCNAPKLEESEEDEENGAESEDANSEDSEDEEVDETEEEHSDQEEKKTDGAGQVASGKSIAKQKSESASTAEGAARDLSCAAACASGRHASCNPILEDTPDLPYTFPVPTTYQELLKVLDKHCTGPETLSLILHRMRVCNAIQLNSDNRYKLQMLYGILMQHFDAVTGLPAPDLPSADVLVPHLYQMAKEVPLYAATAARARITKMQRQVAAVQKGGSGGGWPSNRGLMLLRLFTTIFPVTDFRHPVLTPALLLLGNYMSQCTLTLPRHAAVALFLVNLAHTALAPSKRVMPEVIQCLNMLLASALPASVQDTELPAAVGVRIEERVLCMSTNTKVESSPLPTLSVQTLMNTPEADPYYSSPEYCTAALAATLQSTSKFVDLYADLGCAVEMLEPLAETLQRLGHLPVQEMEMLRVGVLQKMKDMTKFARTRPPMRMHPKKQTSIRMFNPMFEEEGYVAGRDYDPDRVRAEQRKLKKIIKKEEKGAARELRKDNFFLARESQRERDVYEEGREDKTKQVLAMLQQQESDFKSGGQKGMKMFGKKK